MRRLVIASTAAALLAACSGAEQPTPTPAEPPPTVAPTTVLDTPSVSPSAEPSPSPEPEPGAMPSSYRPDDEPGQVPDDALVPAGAAVSGRWFAFTDDGVRIVIAWTEAGADVDRLPHGLAVWRRTETSPHWRLAYVRRRPEGAGIVDVRASTADVTGDRSDDVVVFEGIGGSGACGTWFVLELLEHRAIYRKELCDGRVEPAPPDEPGLVLTRSVYEPGDAHCCPSSIRRTRLAWTGSGWRVVERRETPT